MDRSLSEQGLLEAPSYSSLPVVSEGASVPSVSAAPVSTIDSAAHQRAAPLPTAPPPPPPSTNPALMQLQPQSLSEQSHYTLYQQQQLAASAAPTVAGVCVGGGVDIGQLDPLSAHRDSVMPGRTILWPSLFLSNQDLFHLFFRCIVCQIHVQIHRSKAFCLLICVCMRVCFCVVWITNDGRLMAILYGQCHIWDLFGICMC
jgi:hypothetical protein